ncbi:MAG: thioredoxin-like domain-containing protein [Thermoplasmata archaeon]
MVMRIGSEIKEFPEGFKWLNIENKLTKNDLKGSVLLFDFWTYCCINCMHMLPVLSKIEEKFQNEPFVVIGIHSAKFYNESVDQNIMEAIHRYGINHPVIVDQDMTIWNEYNVRSWPTIMVVNSEGIIVFMGEGEIKYEQLEKVIENTLYDDKLHHSLRISKLNIKKKVMEPRKGLYYPSKIAFSPDMEYIAISDSSNNRVVVTDKNGDVVHIIGNKIMGYRDGYFNDARFNQPQGITWVNNELYIADTGNHAIRKASLDKGIVETIAGTGEMGDLNEGIKNNAKQTRLNSPWDLAYGYGKIYVAMAGYHQIWYYDIDKRYISPFAGMGYENLLDGPVKESLFAQPSGISFYGNALYIADSESSSIRKIDLRSNYVSTIVGKGLFHFGDVDGTFNDARLQHPIGIYAFGDKIYVADTYNHAIKEINLEKKIVSTIIGYRNSVCKVDDPHCDTLLLYEPNDVKLSGNTLYIADTNNHLIRMYDLGKNILNTYHINGLD